jgi:hypothetical protein
MLKLSQWVIAYRKLILVIFLLTSLFSVLAIPCIDYNKSDPLDPEKIDPPIE